MPVYPGAFATSPITFIVQARSAVACVVIRTYGYKGIEVAEALSLSSPTGSRSIVKGESIIDNKKELAVELRKMKI
jgi:hypothetical protein